MTAPPPAQHLERPAPTAARTTLTSVRDDPGRSPWTATWLVAAVAVVIPEVAIWVVDGAP